MNLSELSKEELIAELKRREAQNKQQELVTVIGTIGIDGMTNFVEGFMRISDSKALQFINTMNLRSRFNSHRFYKGFYFKVSEREYKELLKLYNKNNESFANWVRKTKSIKYFSL